MSLGTFRTETRLTVAARAVSILLVSAGLILALGISRNRALQVDEVEHVHAAFNIHQGKHIYRDFWQSHNPLLYFALQGTIEPTSTRATYRRARWLSFAFFVALCSVTSFCAYRLRGADTALLAAGLFVLYSTLVERGIEIRPDGGLALSVALATACLLGLPSHRPSYYCQGLFLGLGFLFTQKGIFACVAFGLLWAYASYRKRQLTPIIFAGLGFSTPLAVMAGRLASSGSLGAFWQANIVDNIRVASGAARYARSFGPEVYVRQEAAHNVLAVALGALSVIFFLWRLLRGARADSEHTAILLLALALTASLWLNPFPFPYLHVTVLPTVLLFTSIEIGESTKTRLGDQALALAAAFILLGCAVTSGPRLWSKAHAQGIESLAHQFRTISEVERITTAQSPTFDMLGLTLRPDSYFVYSMTSNAYSRYLSGGFPRMIAQLRQRPPAVVILSYRTQWLRPPESTFLQSHFAHYDGNLLVPGINLSELEPGQAIRFEVLKGGTFRFDGLGEITVDSKPFNRGALSRGVHTIERLSGAGGARLITVTPPPVPWPPSPPERLFVGFD